MPKRLGEVQLISGAAMEADDPHLLRQQSFDSYLAVAQAQPDNNEAQEALLSIMNQAFEAGEVDFLMQNAMILAATACTDPHLEETATKAGEMFSKATGRNDESLRGNGLVGQGRTANGDRKKSATSTKKRQFAANISQLILMHMAKQTKPSSGGFSLLLSWPPERKTA